MRLRVLLAIAEPELARQVEDLMREEPELEVVQTASDLSTVSSVLRRREVDTLILHEDLHPMPVMELARHLATSFPHVGVILLVNESRPELLRAALRAGVRDVLAPPLSLEELATSVRQAAEWAEAMQQRLGVSNGDGPVESRGRRMIALAGAKGGVGTTTVAVQLALAAVRSGGGQSVCLVDFDLQQGDVGTFFDLPHRRSVSDLVAVADELSPVQLSNTLYRHESGLEILLSPEEGELAEEVTAGVARALLGALRVQYSVVIVDTGSTVTEASAVAIDAADEVLVVTTPDVLAMRAANRLVAMWERLQIRGESGVKVLLNRLSRNSEVQPELAEKVLTAPVAETGIPASFRAFEPAVNTGVPARVGNGLQEGFTKLARETGALAPRPRRRPQLLKAESGQSTVELTGLAGIVLVLILLLWQIALVGYTFVLADHAAREGARALAVAEPVKERVRDQLPGAWADGMKVKTRDTSVEVKLRIPAVVPVFSTPLRVSAKEGTVIEGEPLSESQQ